MRSRSTTFWSFTMMVGLILAGGLTMPLGSSASGSQPQVDLAAVMAGTASSTDWASREYVVPGVAAGGELSKEELQDLATLARSSGKSFDALVAQHEGIDEVSTVATDIWNNNPDVFVDWGAAPTADAGYDFFLTITGILDAKTSALLEQLPVNVQVRYGRPLSSASLESVMGAVGRSLMKDSAIDANSIRIAINDDGAGVDVTFARAAKASDPAVASALETARLSGESTARSDQTSIVFEERPSEAPVRNFATVKGGKQLTFNGAGDCTSGFTANRSGVLGLVTAAHCPNNMEYTGLTGVITFVTAADPSSGGAIDLQFHKTNAGNSTVSKFKFQDGTDASSERTVSSIANPGANTNICLHGITTDYACSLVEDDQACATVEGVFYCGMFVTEDPIGGGGDSGGPMFFGSVAKGFVKGGDGFTLTLGTQVGRVANNLNATVLQN